MNSPRHEQFTASRSATSADGRTPFFGRAFRLFPLRRALALLLSPLAALVARAEPMVPGGYDPADDVLYQFMPVAWRCSRERIDAALAAGSDAQSLEVKHRFGDFRGMTESLDYLAELGITGVWMTPIFPSRAYHSYQHGPADRVNPFFGQEQEFIDFVRAAHARNIKVYIDLVAYGISHESTWFENALTNPPDPRDPRKIPHPDAAWLAITDDERALQPGPVWRPADPADTRRFQGYDFTIWTGEKIGIVWWDLRNPGPRDLVISWCRKWLDPNGDGDLTDGVDGYRLDHVWGRYQSGPNGWGYNVKDFWIPWKKELKKVNPRVFTFAEQAKWETNGEDLLPAHDAALAKPLLFAIRDAIRDADASKLAATIDSTLKVIPKGRTLLGSIGDHDVDRVASSVGGIGHFLATNSTPSQDDRESKAGDHADAIDASSPDADNLARAKVAAAILMTLPLPPVMYFGDEIGMLGKAGNFGSDANDIPRREPFKWTAVGPDVDPRSPMTDYWRAHAPPKPDPRSARRSSDPSELQAASQAAPFVSVIDRRYSKDRDGRSVEEQRGVAGSLLETYRELIKLRRENIALRRGEYVQIRLDPAPRTPGEEPAAPTNDSEHDRESGRAKDRGTDDAADNAKSDAQPGEKNGANQAAPEAGAVWCFERRHAEQRVIVAINLSDVKREFSFTRADAMNGRDIGPWRDATAYKVLGMQRSVRHRLTLPAYATAIVVVE